MTIQYCPCTTTTTLDIPEIFICKYLFFLNLSLNINHRPSQASQPPGLGMLRMRLSHSLQGWSSVRIQPSLGITETTRVVQVIFRSHLKVGRVLGRNLSCRKYLNYGYAILASLSLFLFNLNCHVSK